MDFPRHIAQQGLLVTVRFRNGMATVLASAGVPERVPCDPQEGASVKIFTGRVLRGSSSKACAVACNVARVDAGPAQLAARELREETGLIAETMTLLGTLEITPSTLSQRCWVFLATDLTDGKPQRDAEEQGMRSTWFTRADVERMISDGIITDAKLTAAYALLLLQGRTPAR